MTMFDVHIHIPVCKIKPFPKIKVRSSFILINNYQPIDHPNNFLHLPLSFFSPPSPLFLSTQEQTTEPSEPVRSRTEPPGAATSWTLPPPSPPRRCRRAGTSADLVASPRREAEAATTQAGKARGSPRSTRPRGLSATTTARASEAG